MPLLVLDDGREVPWKIRVSRRSRRVRLTVNPRDGVVMVTPPGVAQAELGALAFGWRDWVARQIEVMGIADAAALGEAEPALPPEIPLRALDTVRPVNYRHVAASAPRVLEGARGELLLSGNCADREACLRALRRWLQRHARAALPPLLAALAAETGFAYGEVGVRAQRSRWGSCSARGDITLNCQILFLPPELARHILLHELCHTRVLDHSPRFWKLMARHEPDHRRLREEMRRSWTWVPPWAMG